MYYVQLATPLLQSSSHPDHDSQSYIKCRVLLSSKIREIRFRYRVVMARWNLVVVVLVVILYQPETTHAHGRLRTPPSRVSMWRDGYNTPKEYTDNQYNCGGFAVRNSYFISTLLSRHKTLNQCWFNVGSAS